MRFYPEFDFLVSWSSLGVSSGVYLAVVAALFFSRSLRSVWPLKHFVLCYNVCQIALCGWMTFAFASSGFSLSNPMGLSLPFSAQIELAMLVHFLSKWLDYCDTAIMLLKQNLRQLTFLHVYHHVSIALVWGFLLQSGDANGTAYFGAFLNSFVHFLMYTHYLVTSLGIKNPFKVCGKTCCWCPLFNHKFRKQAMLTNLQLIQFGLCLLHAVLVVLYEQVLPARLAYLQLAYHTVMLLLFADFKKKQIQEMKREKQQEQQQQKKKE